MRSCQLHENLDWVKYVNDELDCRVEHDLVLETCNQCMEDYMQVVQANLKTPSSGFTDRVMAGLESMNEPKTNRYKTLRPLMHYLVAACLTLAFLELGFFDLIPSLTEQSQEILPQVDYIGELLEHMRLLIGYLKI